MKAKMRAGRRAQTFPDELAIHVPASHTVGTIKLLAVIQVVRIVLYVKSPSDVIPIFNFAYPLFQGLVLFL